MRDEFPERRGNLPIFQQFATVTSTFTSVGKVITTALATAPTIGPSATWGEDLFVYLGSRPSPIYHVDLTVPTSNSPFTFNVVQEPLVTSGSIEFRYISPNEYDEIQWYQCQICGRRWEIAKMERNTEIDDSVIVCPECYDAPNCYDSVNEKAAAEIDKRIDKEETRRWQELERDL